MGGASPVATRHSFDAPLRAAIIAPVDTANHNIFRSMPGCLPNASAVKPLDTYSRRMQRNDRTLGKAERQRLIASVVSRRRVGSQLELMDALADVGCDVAQATISRDIRELGLEKTRDLLGRPRYVHPDRGRRTDPRETLAAVLAQFGRRITVAQNIVVVHSELGSAPAIARALDRLEHPRIVGTLAGDDTCLIIARDTREARSVASELREALP